MLEVNLHNSIPKGCSVQRNCNVPFAGFDPRATAIKQDMFGFHISDLWPMWEFMPSISAITVQDHLT
jgi:hypothetical protein